MAVRTESVVSEQAQTTVSSHPSAAYPGIAGITRVPPPVNEPNLGYLPGSPERAELKARLKAMAGERIDIPVIIGGREIRSGRTPQAGVAPNHQHGLAGL